MIKINTVNITDGINLHFLNTKKFNTVCVAFLIRRELKRNEVTMNSLLSKVLMRGSQKYPTAKDIAIKSENMYGASIATEILKKGDEQIIELFLETYDKKEIFDEALELACEIIMNPLTVGDGFDEEYVEIEKRNLYNEIRGRVNDKREYAKQRCIELMYDNEPFGLYGDGYAEDLNEINSTNLYEHYKKVIAESPIEIIFMGKFSEKEVKDKMREILKINRKEIIYPKLSEIKKGKSKPDAYMEKLDVKQGKLYIGFNTGINPDSSNYFPLLLGNEILGGAGNSKLFVNIREKKSLCYYINSTVFRFKGSILVNSGIDNEDYKKVYNLINDEINKIKSGEFSKQELKNAKKTIESNFMAMMDYNNTVMDFYANQILIKDKKRIIDFVDIIDRVSKREVINSFKNVQPDTVYFLGGEG